MSASTDKKQRAEAIKAGTYKKSIAAQEAAQKKSAENRKFYIGGAILAVIIILAFVLNSGLMYTAPTAVKVGSESFSPAQVNVYYGSAYQEFLSSYGSYATMFGLDTSYGLSGLGNQESIMGGTWKEYFTNTAVSNMQQVVAYSTYAKENGITLSDEDYADIDANVETLKSYADTYGYKSLNAFLAYNYGKGVNEKIYRAELERMALASAGAEAYTDSLSYSDEAIKEYFDANLGEDYDIITYAVYTIDGDTDADGTVSEEEAEAAHNVAGYIVDAYNEAEGTPVEKLNAALAQYGIASTVSETYSRAYNVSSDYSEFLKVQTEEAAGAVDTASGAVVAVFISREDNNFNTASVRHILVQAVADENGEYTEEALAVAKSKAEDILAEYKSGEQTEESFTALAEQYSEDPGVTTNGGLYEVTDKYSYVAEFTDFALANHKPGDTGIVYGESSSYAGYHVMYYVEQGELACDYLAEQSMKNDDYGTWSAALLEQTTTDTTFFSRYVGIVA